MPDFWISQSPLEFSIDQINHILQLVREWLPQGKFIKADKPLFKDFKYEKELMTAFLLTVNSPQKAEN